MSRGSLFDYDYDYDYEHEHESAHRSWARVAAACAFCFVLFSAGAALCAPLSFPEAVEGMKARNESLKAADDEIRQRDAEREAAKGLRMPKVEMEARSYYLDTTINLGMDVFGLDFLPYSIGLQHRDFLKGDITATLPLYTGGRISAANRAAEARQDEAREQSRMTGDQLLSDLATRYYGLCLAQRARDVQQIKVLAMEKHAYRAKRLMEEGIIARVEYLNADVALATARQELDSAERDIKIVTEGLTNIIVGADVPEPSSALFIIRDLEPRETFQGYVNADVHPVLKMLAAKHTLATQGVRAEKGADLPTVYLYGMRQLFDSDLSPMDPAWAFGLGVQQTLFDGHQGHHKVEAARAVEDKVAHMQQKIQRDLKSLVLKRYEEAEKALSQFDKFDKTIELTRENLRVRLKAFEEGLATSVEVVDAFVSHIRVHLGRFKSAYDFDTALFQLLEASGQSDHYIEYLARATAVTAPDPEPALLELGQSKEVPKSENPKP